MIGIFLITHGSLGESLVQCACHVLNKRPPQIAQLGVSGQDDPLDALPLAREMMKLVDSGRGLLLIPLIYGTAMFIVAVFALPLMLERVAAKDYPELEKRNGGTLAGSVGNALVAVLVFLFGWIVTLPLWLIPGMGIVLPVLLAGYLNYRGYSYDALSAHAGADELDGVLARERGGLYLAGVVAGLLAFVPVLNLIAPAYAGLAFIHYGLEALRRARKAV